MTSQAANLALPPVIALSIGKERTKHLQALRVVSVPDRASVSSSAGSRTSPSNSTTLSIVSSDSSSGSSAGSSSGGLSGRGSSRAATSARASTAESRVEGTNPNVRVNDIGATGLRFNGLGVTGSCSAATTSGTGCTGLVCWVSAVEPEHVDAVVVPQTHDQDHTGFKSRADLGQATVVGEGCSLAKGGKLSGTKVRVNNISGDSGDLGGRLRDDHAILNVVAFDLRERTGRCTVGSDELGHNGEWLGGVNGQAGAIEVSDAKSVRVEVTSVRVAGTGVTVGTVGTTAVITGADSLGWCVTRVRSQGLRDTVCLPDIKLRAAGSRIADSSVGVVDRWRPTLNVGLTSNELQVTRALGVAVSNAVLSTSLVVGVLGDTAVGVHDDEVEGTVQTAREVGDVDGEGELLVQQVEDLVVRVIGHQVSTRSDVGTGNEVQAQ